MRKRTRISVFARVHPALYAVAAVCLSAAAVWSHPDPQAVASAPTWFGSTTAAINATSPPTAPSGSGSSPVPAAASPYGTQGGMPKGVDPSEPLDEAMGGRTLEGTPVSRRTPECFPAEQRDVFSLMDQVATGESRELKPLNFDIDGDGKISNAERNAIRGRNTWLLWGAGNETFWNWLQQRGYGLEDFLILLDSRKHDTRFRDGGLINQPGFKANYTRRVLGLYLDVPEKEGSTKLQQPSTDVGEDGKLIGTVPIPADPTHREKGGAPRPLFEAGKDPMAQGMLREAQAYLDEVDDGLDPTVYGYPSGIFGLRLMLNPDFFGNTKAAAGARQYWNDRVAMPKHSNYYTDVTVHSDPKLVRPFRVSMSCGFCHVGPHPLNPPADPEKPRWENLSSIIGDQYWNPQPVFANLLARNNLIYHFLGSQPPGTIDTSLVSTDWINNPNTINAFFDLPSRLQRAQKNSPEQQSAANLLLPSVEDRDSSVNPRHVPRVLLDGADSCGVFSALMRVPLNIGTYSEEWLRTSNPIIGFAHRRPFRIATCQSNSVYWQVNERYRIPYEAAFFTMQNPKLGQSSTGPMKLQDAGQARDKEGKPMVGADGKIESIGRRFLAQDPPEKRATGREAFLQHCAICHSSKQPDGFNLEFTRTVPANGWANAPKPPATAGPQYALPMDFTEWDAFKQSPAFKDYVARIKVIAGDAPADGSEDPFIKANFLSNEVRIPVSLVGTSPARATATNGLHNEVWDNFSSDTYKSLPPVGALRFFNPFSSATPDSYGNNDSYTPGGNGRGYYRPASLISLWATAPYLHNNTLGLYNQNPSVEGRMEAFKDGITKLLWKDKRRMHSVPGLTNVPVGAIHPGDIRPSGAQSAARDTGLIYRLPVDSEIFMAGPFIRQVLTGIVGTFLVSVLEFWSWVVLFVVFLILAFLGQRRHAVAYLILLAVLAELAIALTGLTSVLGWKLWLIPIGLAALALVFLYWPEQIKSWWTPVRVAWLGAGLLALLAVLLIIDFAVTGLPNTLGWWLWLIPIALLVLAAYVFYQREGTHKWWTPKGVSRAMFGLLITFAAVIAVGLSLTGLPETYGNWLWIVPLIPVALYRTQNASLKTTKTWVMPKNWNPTPAVQALFGLSAVATLVAGVLTYQFIHGAFGPLRFGPIPRGTPANLILNIDQDGGVRIFKGLTGLLRGVLAVRKDGLTGDQAYEAFTKEAAGPLMEASRCPDFVTDRGHYFGEALTDEEKNALIAFLKTL